MSSPEMSGLRTFVMKHPGSCSGMFWRGNPLTSKHGAGLPDYPKNGALLRGKVHMLEKSVEGNKQWLEVIEFKQAGSSSFKSIPENAWMIFEQGGLLLHEQK